ncbi:SEC-C domain-containing protein [Bacillus thuringiensis]|uniref:SEC-C domain-containing protein n=1 Tax=Bacillus cereus group TaxID=86661 RepID=UPI000AE6C5CF|nr:MULTISPECIES: SEC-C domain-containing protein [Bacillus cereus group]MCT6944481.1 SEC-C domain-containing protein [Bacillus thuringiensis]MED2075019.1 SEC-C domain-containing protein [Bacillus thuringiensis]MEE2011354.1 SEC-C domain-containing protein [Bacillus thuringiensis]
MKLTSNMKCPCGSGKKYKNCCKTMDDEEKIIYLRAEQKLLFELCISEELEDFSFSYGDIKIELDVNEGKFIAFQTRAVPNRVVKALLEEHANIKCMEKTVSDDVIMIIKDLWSPLSSAIDDLTNWIHLTLFINHNGRLTNAATNTFSIDQKTWKKGPIDLEAHIIFKQSYNLTQERKDYIQRQLNNERLPFIAFKYLIKAKNEEENEIKWINATIAAELAVKEFYMNYDEKLNFIVLEMPSPPLYKMYGKMLESITGKKCSKLKSIQKGVEIRNSLVHRPSEQKLSTPQVNEYISDVETSIFELLDILGQDKKFVDDFNEYEQDRIKLYEEFKKYEARFVISKDGEKDLFANIKYPN